MLATGAMAFVQGYFFWGLVLLVLLGALGKTLGAYIPYFVADKIEDLFSSRLSKFLGITHEQIESFGAHLGKGFRDYLILIILRALPIVPSSVLSVGCGLLKVRLKLFFISTFVGSIIRDAIYIYLGYIGTNLAISLFVKKTASIESLVEMIVVIGVFLCLGYLYFRQNHKKTKLES